MSYKKMPASQLEAHDRALKLQQFLSKWIGGKWSIRVHENLGWFYSCSCGTISVSEYADSYGGGGYGVMNGMTVAGVGSILLDTYHPKTKKELCEAIQDSIDGQKALIAEYIRGYNKNKAMNCYVALY